MYSFVAIPSYLCCSSICCITTITTLHTRSPLLVSDAKYRRLDLVGMFSLQFEQLGLLGRVGYLGQQIVEDLHGGMLADVCTEERKKKPGKANVCV